MLLLKLLRFLEDLAFSPAFTLEHWEKEAKTTPSSALKALYRQVRKEVKDWNELAVSKYTHFSFI